MIPQAIADSYIIANGETLSVSAPGVLSNDIAASGTLEMRTPSATYGPFHGMASLNDDGSFSYTPAAGFRGFDRFEYRINGDSGTSSWVPVSIAVGDPSLDCGGCGCNSKVLIAIPSFHGFLPFDNRDDGTNANLTRYLTAHIVWSIETPGGNSLDEAEITIDERNGSYTFTIINGSAPGTINGYPYGGFDPATVTRTETTWNMHLDAGGGFVTDITITLSNPHTVDDVYILGVNELLTAEDINLIPDHTFHGWAFNNDNAVPTSPWSDIWPGDVSGEAGISDSSPTMVEFGSTFEDCIGAELGTGDGNSGMVIKISKLHFYGKYCVLTDSDSIGVHEYACESHGSGSCVLNDFVTATPTVDQIDAFNIKQILVTINRGSQDNGAGPTNPCCP